METHYIIYMYKGSYESSFANFELRARPDVVYSGILCSDPESFTDPVFQINKKVELIQKFLKEANTTKKFDSKKLEERLKT